MMDAQKIILIALAAVGLICALVGFTLMHHIGGFMRTVEEEAREESEGREAQRQTISDGDAPHTEKK